MNIEFSSTWFRSSMEAQLRGYVVTYRFYPEGDFGSLDQVAFNSDYFYGEIDYWSSGYLGVGLWDRIKDEQALNVFLDPDQGTDKIAAINNLTLMLDISLEE